MSIPTPHITAKAGDYAKTVLMPGDPLRAKFIADNYLCDVRQVNAVRGMLGFTGLYNGKPVSVQGSGMGMPSMGIYSYELFNFYGVENIIRIGTAGGLHESLSVGCITVALGACTDSNYVGAYGLPGNYAPVASYKLLRKSQEAADKLGFTIYVGNLLSSDVYYGENLTAMERWRDMGILAVEMEAAALYINAARAEKNALCICTISNTIFDGKEVSAETRQNSFTQMMDLSLNMI